MANSATRMAFTDLDFAIVDVETTGFDAKAEIVEIAVIHLHGASFATALETLVQPLGRIGNREVHGISNRDVRKAPLMVDLAPQLRAALVGRIVVAHNAAFDLRFLREPIEDGGWATFPHLCTMELLRALHGEKLDLLTACEAMGIEPTMPSHRAMGDARSTADLLAAIFRECADHEVTTFADFDDCFGGRICNSVQLVWQKDPIKEYRTFIEASIALEEAAEPTSELPNGARRRVHAEVMYAALGEILKSGEVDDGGVRTLHDIALILKRLGWAPGESA